MTYTVVIDAPAGRTFTIRTPLDAQLAHLVGSAHPTAQQLADYFAGEHCDSGSVTVRGGGAIGQVARR